MKEKPLSNCERDFNLQIIKQKKRLDGRGAYAYRDVKIYFGIDYGCCHVNIGDTMVMAQVTCELVEPKQTRPNEGTLMINIEFNNVACPGFEPGRLSRKGVQINRLLERCIKECRCVDMESLCVIAEKQVWEIRVDVKVLNHDGNILDASCMAAITALSHFKRPDVSVEDGKITIHPADEKAFIPLSVHHMPICTTFSFFHSGDFLLLDASYDEERVREGHMIIAMNKHREICALHMSGTHLLHKDQVSRCTNISASKVLELTELIQSALHNDKLSRESGGGPGSVQLSVQQRMHTLAKRVEQGVQMEVVGVSSDKEEGGDSEQEMDGENEEATEKDSDSDGQDQDTPATEVGSGGASSWNVEHVMEDDDQLSKQTRLLARKRKRKAKKVKAEPDNADSEEETVVTLQNPS